jgi:hypothetical protein
MHRVETIRLVIPCPTCSVPQCLTAAFLPARASEAESRAVLRECARCWIRRARALNVARENLRHEGELGHAGSLLTWRGEIVDDSREHDALEGAVLSELLRRDIPAAQGARLLLPALLPAEIEAGAKR